MGEACDRRVDDDLKSIVVTDGELRSSLAATRSLAGSFDVHVVSTSVPSLAGVSRGARSETAAPDPMRTPGAFREAVDALAGARGAVAVLPASDAACRALLLDGPWRSGARIVAPARDAYERSSHKGEALRLGREAGLDVPDGDEVSDLGSARSSAERLGWPVIVKPVESVAALRKRSVVRVADPGALECAWREHVAPGAALVQREVPGHGEGLFVLRIGGETRAAFAHRRLREKPPSGGVSVLCESIATDPDLLARVERVLDACGFDGIAMAEFRRDGERRWLMELNARLWGSLQLAIDAGVDFPTLAVRAALGEPAGVRPEYRVGLRSRWLLGDLDHSIALARGARDAAGRSGAWAALGVLLRPTPRPCRLDNPRAGDVRPFFHELRLWFRALHF